MTHLNKASAILLGALVTLSWPASGGPPNVVVSDAGGNTAMGTGALAELDLNLAQENTAAGYNALASNGGASGNSAFGAYALTANTGGEGNSAFGQGALYSNQTGYFNSAVGDLALGQRNIHGSNNTAVGAYALRFNDADNNTATGFSALTSNTTGTRNTAIGVQTLQLNTEGEFNTASGAQALGSNTTGSRNTAIGQNALGFNTTGNYNIAVGDGAGYAVKGSAQFNIEIGNKGKPNDYRTIRIGDIQYATYIAGISSARVTGSAVYVTSDGKLGVLASSERYKTDVAPMGSNSAKLQQLRPVTFHLKTDPQGPLQYGLIAEEVSNVYPDLVIRDSAGGIEGVRYEELTPMLLNEVQRQQNEIASQRAQLSEIQHQLAEMMDINRSMQAALLELRTREERIAQR
jgi:hypothetical protein